ncbi:hypothetical protein VOLCADRAFT_97253 [Volvox carteri f. nagariensis]|uniref:Uncharacterized protein n=1 Tax=Volvox carteri f. nagariensis TaxID=3068 RepID=D8UC94_VOLCA|nr:uncharacterized protein VOLCADRAFT_97253 [Volvox carteri f. nagariensis]EFJ42606.1 hypothetical protein VOLCADRAFT_97253 [Volvox carteri f. nagariensis]|eukprot:XP_002956257.1 hypothetical protein VOLCADRAFT_97253 [Volvox carteri f. nagariensis]
MRLQFLLPLSCPVLSCPSATGIAGKSGALPGAAPTGPRPCLAASFPRGFGATAGRSPDVGFGANTAQLGGVQLTAEAVPGAPLGTRGTTSIRTLRRRLQKNRQVRHSVPYCTAAEYGMTLASGQGPLCLFSTTCRRCCKTWLRQLLLPPYTPYTPSPSPSPSPPLDLAGTTSTAVVASADVVPPYKPLTPPATATATTTATIISKTNHVQTSNPPTPPNTSPPATFTPVYLGHSPISANGTCVHGDAHVIDARSYAGASGGDGGADPWVSDRAAALLMAVVSADGPPPRGHLAAWLLQQPPLVLLLTRLWVDATSLVVVPGGAVGAAGVTELDGRGKEDGEESSAGSGGGRRGIGYELDLDDDDDDDEGLEEEEEEEEEEAPGAGAGALLAVLEGNPQQDKGVKGAKGVKVRGSADLDASSSSSSYIAR